MSVELGVNAYTTVDSFRAWADARLYDHTPFHQVDIEGAIVVVSVDFIDANYMFKGRKLDKEQVMGLPTTCVSVANISNAVNQAVWMQLNGDLFVEAQDGGEIVSESSTLGDLSKSVTYSEGSAPTYTKSTTRIDRLLKDFVVGSAGGMGLFRG